MMYMYNVCIYIYVYILQTVGTFSSSCLGRNGFGGGTPAGFVQCCAGLNYPKRKQDELLPMPIYQ